MSIAGITAVRYVPVTPIAPVRLGEAQGVPPVQSGGGDEVSSTAPSRAAPPPGLGMFLDKTA